jgi:signal transduction histidine kinase
VRVDEVDRRYVEVSTRVMPKAMIGAYVINALIVLACATSWTRFVTAFGLQTVIVFFNIGMNSLVPRFGQRADMWRGVGNSLLSTITYVVIDWPLPAWLWIPYTAFTFDRLGGRHTYWQLVIMTITMDVTALASGVPVIYPVTFTALGAIGWFVSGARIDVIRDMLIRAETQRDELEAAHEALKAEVAMRQRAELELRQAQKLEAIGRLAAGVAHEINTPIQFVNDNIRFVGEAVGDLFELRRRFVAARAATADEAPAAYASASELESELDVGYLEEHVPKALELAADGCGRIATIVRSMKQFAHTDGRELAPADVNSSITATLAITRHHYKLVADVDLQLGELPQVTCNIGEVNQVLLNLVVNAAHAIEDRRGASGARGTIRITTSVDRDHAVIAVTDDGAGIPADVRDRIFDPFFTTKAVGRGSGQGLSIARSMMERHGGTLTFETELGSGTTFTIRLPISPEPAALVA